MSDKSTSEESESENHIKPGEPGHNSKKVVWARWQKKRTFVRALEDTYGEVYKRLFSQPRVYHATDWQWHGGPQVWDKAVINPQSVNVAQSIECHLDAYAPNGAGQKHGHMNSAAFFVITGKGRDIHDGQEMQYEAGDALVVENGCVHQHINRGDDEMLVLVMKAKPLFLFMHLLFQKMVEYPKSDVPKGGENYAPPTHI
jgi:quercetin dioxygenase-like cupin family protein